ncbi:MAG: dfrA [Candidatus Saccharibacteria bacterium]|nr:dfrA [Candidatus Saccharibacteria bacterium]
MIRFIAVMDSRKGIANERGIPWQGQVPSDTAYFRSMTLHGNLIMGAGWYKEQIKPLPDRRNLVATSSSETLRPGFEKVTDVRTFLQQAKEDIWVGGGAALFASTLDLADELYLTKLDGDWHCTKFFPEYEQAFELVSQSESLTENGIVFKFTVYKRKPA